MLLWGSLCHQVHFYIWDRLWAIFLCLATGSRHLLCEDRMDRFLVKGALGGLLGKRQQEQTGGSPAELGENEESTRKRPRRETPTNGVDLAGPSWRHIRAEGLDCDYTVLFGKAEADEIFRDLEQEVEYFTGALARVQVFGKWHNVPRKQATYGDAGLTYTFSGLTLSPKPWIPVLERVRDHVSLVTGQTFNFVLVNRYKDGCDHIGEHRDDERELAPGSPIASVSFGACRDFFFRHKDSRGKNPSRRVEVVRLPLAHGSLLMMNHPTNTYWYHSLPVRKKVLAARVNLTFRKILQTRK
ncbi:alkB-like protein 2, alpha-ketoglutarate dependent dioxygenase [Rhinolophus ferrumequinum]|uniref:DNA oxidative demethylase ALKBH2 n=2 Tax=Rhinolophus ferrumequinum TaxID=59479 RepID=A0A671FRP4_RHIFE|nr:DNA oxidative demethylase ALKBH2 [Rhinolophus ferrumequinum]XP_032953888.1 DNA oxidative demethylase ALKBH2 [Rhinolophus ferrumequinum]XP_032953889.1 DNA oxidative demethylase ALKBH2 [Rhinolophus ferrumequinum]XP_032953890.1 DNA oxidative demethylase ALKBH2 [Rhinolophus ferrumequinum]KAF6277597.1 alkB-like protein 2, alpha-ketoglutarate dependent dioxygenase [Rhinolophus ferrumequinum]